MKYQRLLWFVFLFQTAFFAHVHADWERDYLNQRPSTRRTLEARYVSAQRDGFLIEADQYTVSLDLGHSGQGHRVPYIALGEERVFENGSFEIKDASGQVWSTRESKSKSRVNLYRRGPYYHEVHWLDVSWENERGEILPVKGEIVWYCYPDTFRMALILHATSDTSVQEITLQWQKSNTKGDPEPFIESSNDLTLVRSASTGARCAWFPSTKPWPSFQAQAMEGAALLWDLEPDVMSIKAGEKLTVGCGFVATENTDDLEHWNELNAQLNPLTTDHLKLIKGMNLKFDPQRGDYVIASHNPGGFSYHYYENPNAYLMAKMEVINEPIPRCIYIRHEVGSGSKGQVECGVVIDAQDQVVPVLVQISKNFAGEKEEKFYNPTDTPFSEIIYPIFLDSEERREFGSLQLYQNWGNHPLKQFSSLGAWMDYYHMSTGVTETTCYVPFKFYTGISIADLRGMSGRMWESQPQHDNVGGHVFMEYEPSDLPGRKVDLEYLGTRFHSTGPNWAHVTLSYLSSDERLQMELETFEYPQLDELRNFIRLRVKALDDIPIDRWSRDFRLMQIDTRTQSLRYQNVTWIDQADNIVTRKLKFDDTWVLEGEPLSGKAPSAVLWNSPKGNNAFILEEWRGRLGGKPIHSWGISCEGRATGDSNLVLHPITDAKGLKKGDTFEVDLFIMPFGKENSDFQAAMLERQRYGLDPVKLTVQSGGQKIQNFPPRIRWIQGPLNFSIQGGYSTVAVLIEGLPDFKGWNLQKEINGKWVKVRPADGKSVLSIQGEGEQRFVCEDGAFGLGLRIDLEGHPQSYRFMRN